MSKAKTAISPTRAEDYPGWYQKVIQEAELAQTSPSRGCMIIRPWGYGIWENIQSKFDKRIKETGHENAYFPIFIPLSLLEKEAKHVDGFAKECAVVTHHRLESVDGKLVPSPDAKLTEPMIVRPTSETIIGEVYSNWINSYRDLPLLINQWANVVRWEMRPRLFLRTAEFLWQEGHTVHATQEEAEQEVLTMLSEYKQFLEETLAIPVIDGEKSTLERFPGAVKTYCVEAMMQDGKALQAATSHYLGQNFSKASDIKFLDKDGITKYAYTTSWGASSRLIGALIMVHSDDDGLRLPPQIASKHVVIMPFLNKEEQRVREACSKLQAEIKDQSFGEGKVICTVDDRDIRGGDKTWGWVKKGIPIRIEIGARDLEAGVAIVCRRDKAPRDKEVIALDKLASEIPRILDEIQNNYFNEARAYMKENTNTDCKNMSELLEFFEGTKPNAPHIKGGFARIKWCGSVESEKELAKHKLTVRCIPFDQQIESGTCAITGEPANTEAIVALSY